MEEFTRSKLTKLSAFKSRFQAHGAIVRSLSPFFERAARLESGDANSGRSLLAISAGCVCSSSTSAVIDAQVPPCHRIAAEDVGHANSGSPHGNLKSRYNATKSSARKEMPKKSRFSNSFNKGYARVSDVSSTSCSNGDALVSPKSGNKVVKYTEGHAKPNSQNSCKNANSKKTGDSRGCSSQMSLGAYLEQSDFGNCCSESNLSTHREQGHLCKREKQKFDRGYLPVVEYTWDPCKAFYESMLEMVTVSRVVYDVDLEDMFTYHLVLNASHHHAHIKEAFTMLLTHLYKSKLAPHSL